MIAPSAPEQIAALLRNMTSIDLAPPLERGIPVYPTHPHLVIDPTISHRRDGYYCQSISMAEHTGCHCDAPAHTVAGMMDQTIDTFPVTTLMRVAKTYDFSDRDWRPGELLTVNDILAFEARNGAPVGPGEIALVNFGWLSRYWHVDERAHFYARNQPGMDEDVARLFLERQVAAVGADTIACEIAMVDGISGGEFGHQTYWLPNGILIIECLANLSRLPRTSFMIAVPLPLRRGSGSPLRPVAFF